MAIGTGARHHTVWALEQRVRELEARVRELEAERAELLEDLCDVDHLTGRREDPLPPEP